MSEVLAAGLCWQGAEARQRGRRRDLPGARPERVGKGPPRQWEHGDGRLSGVEGPRGSGKQHVVPLWDWRVRHRDREGDLERGNPDSDVTQRS